MLLHFCMKCYDKEMRDKLWREALAKAYHDEAVRERLASSFAAAFDLFEEIINESVVDCPFDAPNLIARCVLTRWLYAVLAVLHLRDNWLGWITFVEAVMAKETSDKKVYTYAYEAYKMMNIRPPVPEGEDVDNNATPSFYAMAEFVSSFCARHFTPFYNMMKKKDPHAQISGCLSGHMGVISFFLETGLDGLADTWETDADYADYLDLIKNYKDLGSAKKGGREWFMEAPKKFIEEYTIIIKKYFSQWQSTALLPYVFAGDYPDVSSELARWIIHGELTPSDERPQEHGLVFRDKQVSFPFLQHEGEDVPTASLRNIMLYLTDAADVHQVSTSPLIEGHRDLLENLAAAEGKISINLPSTYPDLASDDSESDVNLDVDYPSFSLMTKARMIAHPNHNQGAEQAVGESRRFHQQNRSEEKRSALSSLKSMGLDSIKAAAIKTANEMLKAKAEADGKDYKYNPSPSGSSLMVPLLAERLNKLDEIDEAIKQLPEGSIDLIIKQINGSNNNTKRKRDEMFKNIEATLQRSNKRRKTNTGGSIYITAVMGGEITISKLKKSEGHEPHLLAELDNRHIRYNLDDDSWTDLKKKLRNCEYGRLYQDGVRAFEREEDVKTFVPLSEKMRELLEIG